VTTLAEQWKEESREEGRKAERHRLLKLLKKPLGGQISESAAARVHAPAEEQLSLWTDRSLDAESVDDLLR